MKVQEISAPTVLHGTNEEIVNQIFNVFIGQIHDNIQKQNSDQALEFAYLVAANGIGGLLNQVADNQLDDMAKLLHKLVDESVQAFRTIQTKKS